MDTTDIKVYKASKGWRIFFIVGMPPLIALFTYMILLPFIDNQEYNFGLSMFFILFGSGFVTLFLYSFVMIFKWRIEILPDRFREVGVFKTKEVIIDKVEGIRIIPTQYIPYILFETKDPKAKKVKISFMMSNKEEFATWIDSTFRNLTAEEVEQEIETIANNDEMGSSEEERLGSLARVRKWAYFINGVGVAALFWSMIYPKPYSFMIWVLIFIPIVALASLKHFYGILKFDAKQHSTYPTIAVAFTMPCFGLMLRAVLDWNLLEWEALWAPFSIISFVLYWLFLFYTKGTQKKTGYLALILVFCAIYGFGASITLNGVLDSSLPTVYKAKVLDKRISDGKTTSYYLELSPWGPRTSNKEVDVPKNAYNNRNIDDEVNVIVNNGFFKIPWFYVK